MTQTKNHIQPLLEQAHKLFRHCRQGSYKTRERYFAAFKRFLLYLAVAYRLQKIANISGKHLASYVQHMKNNGLSAATIKTDLAGIRFWHDQIPQTKHRLPDNRAFNLERRKLRGMDRTWTEKEFAYMTAKAYGMGRQDYAGAMVLARYCGLRIHEVFRIDTATARLALKNGYLTVKGKGGKIRDVPNSPYGEQVLKQLLEGACAGQKLFVASEKATHLAIKELQQFIADNRPPRKNAPESTKITFHGLRHMFAVEAYQKLIAAGRSEVVACSQVSRWLGHEREEVTAIYLASLREKSV